MVNFFIFYLYYILLFRNFQILLLISYLARTPFFFLFLVSWLALPSESVSESVGKRSKPRYILLIAYIPLYFSMFFTYTLTVKIIYLHCKNHIPSVFFNDTFRWKTPTEKPWRSRAYYAILWEPGPSKKRKPPSRLKTGR